MKIFFYIIFVVVLLAGLGWAATIFLPSSVSWIAAGPPSATSTATSTPQQQTAPPQDTSGLGKTSGRTVPAGGLEYYNAYYHISLLYPNTLKAGEHPEDGGGMTVTFEDVTPKTVSGFQIFIVPFSGAQITDERFKEDDPSGVRDNLKNITVAGAVGAEFDSTNFILGPTHEVWFVHDGYLYEVTTFKELGSWLDSLVSTWQFTEATS